MDTLEGILGQKVPSAEVAPVIREPALEALPSKIARNMQIYDTNPWAMVEDSIIYTLDQANLQDPIRNLPDYPWLKAIAMEWMDEKMLAIVKSRRMIITWTMVFLHLWLAMFREGAAIFFVSDKEEKSDELVRRAEFIFNYIPDDMVLKPKMKPSYCYMDFPGINSYIQGVAMGANQLRQYTATALFFDEFAFWEKAKETFMASKPTTEGGGRLTCVSSPKESFFKEVCFDLIV